MKGAKKGEHLNFREKLSVLVASRRKGMEGIMESLEETVASRNPKRIVFAPPFVNPIVVITSEEDVHRIWKGEQANLDKVGSSYEALRGMFGDGQVLTRRGERWKIRKKATGKTLQPTKIQDLDERVHDIVEMAQQRDAITAFDTHEVLKNVSIQMSTKILFGMDLSSRETRSLTDAVSVLNEYVAGNVFTFPLRERMRKRFPPMFRKASQSYLVLLKMAERFLSEGNSPFMTALRAHGQENGGPLTSAEVQGEIINMIIASYGNVATAMAWSIDLLAEPKNQHLQEKIVHEHSAGKKPTDPDSTAQLVFNEAMRLFPPVYLMTRKATNTIRIQDENGEFIIPKGATVILSPYLIQRNPAIWPSPQEFIPERFNLPVDPATYIPFGFGERVCVGANLAAHIGPYVIDQLVSTYHFSSPDSAKPSFYSSLTPVKSNKLTAVKRD